MPAALSSSEPTHFDLYRSGLRRSELISAEQLFRLRIPSGQKQLPCPLKETMLHVLLFRRSTGFEFRMTKLCLTELFAHG